MIVRALLIALALVGCKRHGDAATNGSSAKVTIVGCAPAEPIPSAPAVAGPTAMGHADRPVKEAPAVWFPYARHAIASADVVKPVAARARAALSEHLDELDHCLAGHKGSLVAMLEVAPDGTTTARVGGLGDDTPESCVASAIGKLKIQGAAKPVELECGLTATRPGPLRVTPNAGYRQVGVSHTDVDLEGAMQPRDGNRVVAPPAPPDAVYLVVAERDAPGPLLESVFGWLSNAPAVLISVTADGGAPVFVAMGPDRQPFHPPDAPRVAVEVTGDKLIPCVEQHRGTGLALVRSRDIDRELHDTLAACSQTCDGVIEVGGADFVAKDLVAATSAVRRTGHDPVIVIGPRCEP